MLTQQPQSQEAGDVTGFNDVATRGGAAAVELRNRMLHTCSPPQGRARLRRGGRSGGRVLKRDSPGS